VCQKEYSRIADESTILNLATFVYTFFLVKVKFFGEWN
jgi:hypothetical protein